MLAWWAARWNPSRPVVTGASQRAIETALAMGYAVDDTVYLPSGYLPGRIAHHEWHWLSLTPGTPTSWHSCRSWPRSPKLTVPLDPTHGRRTGWRRRAGRVPGRRYRTRASEWLPHADHGLMGPPYGDGARLCFDRGSFVGIDFHWYTTSSG